MFEIVRRRRFAAALKYILGESIEEGPVFFSTGSVFYAYAAGTSASAEVFLEYSATGDLAGDTNTFKLPYTFFLLFAV